MNKRQRKKMSGWPQRPSRRVRRWLGRGVDFGFGLGCIPLERVSIAEFRKIRGV